MFYPDIFIATRAQVTTIHMYVYGFI